MRARSWMRARQKHGCDYQDQDGAQGLAVAILGLCCPGLKGNLLPEQLNAHSLQGLHPCSVLVLCWVPCLLLGSLPGNILYPPGLYPHLPLLCHCHQVLEQDSPIQCALLVQLTYLDGSNVG